MSRLKCSQDVVGLLRILAEHSPVLTDGAGIRFPVSDLCAYWCWSQWEEFLRDGPKRVSRMRLRLAAYRARWDRRWVCRVDDRDRRATRFVHVLGTKPLSWNNQFEGVLDLVKTRVPDLGVVVHEGSRGEETGQLSTVGRQERPQTGGHWVLKPGHSGGERTTVAQIRAWCEQEDLDIPAFFQWIKGGLGIQGAILRKWLNHLSGAVLRWPADLFLLNNDLEAVRRSGAMFGQEIGKQVVAFQHGLINDSPPYRTGIADKYLLWGSGFAKILERHGIPREKICVVGAPQYDSWPAVHGPHLRADNYPFTILYAAQPASWEMPAKACIELLEYHKAVVSSLPAVRVRIRLHPREQRVVRNRVMEMVSGVEGLELDEAGTIRQALEHADVVTTVFSTVTLDALAAGRPVVLLDFAGQSGRMPLERRPPLFSAGNKAELPQVIESVKKYLDGHQWKESDWGEVVGHYLSGLDGGATSRAADEICQVLEGRCRAS